MERAWAQTSGTIPIRQGIKSSGHLQKNKFDQPMPARRRC